ncbi:MAG: helix-turn-helix transcriptional regulator [Firmicutes bacterium]|nr:helix-turn-helix transcriptional regulator [Bacillota bacterium]
MTESPCIGQKIRALRKKKGMTQQELAGDAFTKSFISQIEKNHARPSLKSLQIIADRLGKPVAYFLDEDYGPRPDDPDKVDHLILLATRLEQENKNSDAANYYKEALSLTDKRDYQRRGRLYLLLGKTHHRLNQPQNAMQMLELAVAELELTRDWGLLSYAHVALGELLLAMGDLEQATHSLEKALDAAQRHPQLLHGLESRILANLGIAYARSKQYEIGETNLLLALEKAEEDNSFYMYGDVCAELGHIYFHQQALEKAGHFTDRAWYFYSAISNLESQIECQIRRGAIKLAQDDLALAERYFLEAAEKSKEAGYVSQQAHALESLAQAYLEAPSPHKLNAAQVILEEAYHLYTEPTQQARALQLLGEVYHRQGNLDKARHTLENAAQVLMQSAEKPQLAEVYSRLGELSQLQGDTDQAATFFQQSVSIFREMQLKGS